MVCWNDHLFEDLLVVIHQPSESHTGFYNFIKSSLGNEGVWKSIVAGIGAGGAAAAIANPIDVVKIRMYACTNAMCIWKTTQVSQMLTQLTIIRGLSVRQVKGSTAHPRLTSFWSGLVSVYRTNGVQGLYRVRFLQIVCTQLA